MENRTFISVRVYRDASVLHTFHQVTNLPEYRFFVEVPDGNYTYDQLMEMRENKNNRIAILEHCERLGYNFFRPDVIPAGYHSMFGGNFVWTSDSRFSNIYKYPVPVHDRVE